MSEQPKLFMVFDCESIGLHGETFAVGYVVVTGDGEVVGDRVFTCSPDTASGTDEGRAWITENCPPLVWNCSSPREVRRFFWAGWQSWKDQGAVLVAHVAWPVEARFLAACVDDQPDQNTWNGPYPLHELASFMVAAGMDPTGDYGRLPDEPQHDPLGDARQSARLLTMALARLAAQQQEGGVS
jgi:hypothetical protein